MPDKLPRKSDDIRPVTYGDLTEEYVSATGYSITQQRILSPTMDDLELELDLQAYEKMEKDTTISKVKRILLTSVLADDLQFAPSASKDEVGPEEYETYVEIMAFCQRMIGGLERPFRETLEQLLGNGIRYGHGIAEIEYEYRLDGSSTKPPETKTPKRSAFSAFMGRMGFNSKESGEVNNSGIKRPQLRAEETRLMPKSIMVKPRGKARFVVDKFMHQIGIVSENRGTGNVPFNQIIRRDKFLVLTVNKTDEDPRGRSMYRPSYTWVNLKSQVPTEMLRFILEELVPKIVAIASKQRTAGRI